MAAPKYYANIYGTIGSSAGTSAGTGTIKYKYGSNSATKTGVTLTHLIDAVYLSSSPGADIYIDKKYTFTVSTKPNASTILGTNALKTVNSSKTSSQTYRCIFYYDEAYTDEFTRSAELTRTVTTPVTTKYYAPSKWDNGTFTDFSVKASFSVSTTDGSDNAKKYYRPLGVTLTCTCTSKSTDGTPTYAKTDYYLPQYSTDPAKTPLGKHFDRWYNEEYGQSIGASGKYIAGYHWISNKAAATYHFYPVFEPNNYTITFVQTSTDVIDGSAIAGGGGTSTKEVTFGCSLGSITKPSANGYNFIGYWSKNTDGTYNKKYYDATGSGVDGVVYDIPDNATLYARYERAEFNLTLNKNTSSTDYVWNTTGTSGWLSSSNNYYKPCTYKAKYNSTYPTPTITLPGYMFDGWWTSSTGGTRITGEEIMPANNTTIYAHWEQGVKVIFDCAGGIKPDSYPAESGDNHKFYLVLKNNTTNNNLIFNPTKENYVLDGWYTGENGTGTKVYGWNSYQDSKWNSSATTFWNTNGTWKYTSSITLYANWVKANSYAYWNNAWHPIKNIYARYNGAWKLVTEFDAHNGTEWKKGVQ